MKGVSRPQEQDGRIRPAQCSASRTEVVVRANTGGAHVHAVVGDEVVGGLGLQHVGGDHVVHLDWAGTRMQDCQLKYNQINTRELSSF